MRAMNYAVEGEKRTQRPWCGDFLDRAGACVGIVIRISGILA